MKPSQDFHRLLILLFDSTSEPNIVRNIIPLTLFYGLFGYTLQDTCAHRFGEVLFIFLCYLAWVVILGTFLWNVQKDSGIVLPLRLIADHHCYVKWNTLHFRSDINFNLALNDRFNEVCNDHVVLILVDWVNAIVENQHYGEMGCKSHFKVSSLVLNHVLWCLHSLVLQHIWRLTRLFVEFVKNFGPNTDLSLFACEISGNQLLLDFLIEVELWETLSDHVHRCFNLRGKVWRCNILKRLLNGFAVIGIDKLSVKSVELIQGLLLHIYSNRLLLSLDNFIKLCIEPQLGASCSEESP